MRPLPRKSKEIGTLSLGRRLSLKLGNISDIAMVNLDEMEDHLRNPERGLRQIAK